MLVAIAIPVFTSQLEKSRESTDAADIRNTYAEVMVKIIEDPQAAQAPDSYTCRQMQDGWQNTEALSSLNNLAHTATDLSDVTTTIDLDDIKAEGTVTFTYTPGSSTTSPELEISCS